MNKLTKVLSSLTIVGSLILSPVTSYAATPHYQYKAPSLTQQSYNTAIAYRTKALSTQKAFTDYVINNSNPELSQQALQQAITIFKSIPNVSFYNKFKNTKYYSAIMQGGYVVMTYNKLMLDFYQIDQANANGEDVSDLQQMSRDDAGKVLNALTTYNNILKKDGIKPIPSNAYDPEMMQPTS